MEFLVEFEVNVPDGAPVAEVKDRESAEGSAAAKLVNEGHLVRVWNRPAAAGNTTVVGLYRADSEAQLDGLLGALPIYEWMHITVTPLQPHPNDPAGAAGGRTASRASPHAGLPARSRPWPTAGARRRRPGTPAHRGADRRHLHWSRDQREAAPGRQRRLAGRPPDGTTLGDIRYTLQTDRDELLYVQSWGIRHGSAEVLARLGRGEDVDASEYTFRTATRIETGTPDLDWLNKGVFISVASRQAASVIYETYLVA